MLSALDEKQTSTSTRQASPPPPPHSNNIFTTTLRALQNELEVTERLLRSNFVGFLFIFLGGLLSRVVRAPPTVAEGVAGTTNALLVGLLCSYVFDICNQTTSPDEDSLNKPHRPIPAGLITVNQAKVRWLLVWSLGPLVMHYSFGFWAMVHLFEWEALITFCYVWPRWFSYFMRNFFASFAYCILGRLLNQVLAKTAPGWDISFVIDFSIFCWFMGSIHVQEFHDLEGDRKSDRKTLPMLLSLRGQKVLRVVTSIYILAFGGGLAFVGYQKMDQDYLTAPMSVLQLISSAVLAYRIVASTSPEMDKATYHKYYYIPVLLILLSLALVTK
ncbi:UbiA prenyltransferase family-domain-containing protein [Apiospora phragmitis]|uniref:UbiA prenyltransferase family-domain-containing protein n=1 Tax=Apiospora phragmitis TaxID=2905665 RepID=A0ABR1UK12_9PEZI